MDLFIKHLLKNESVCMNTKSEILNTKQYINSKLKFPKRRTHNGFKIPRNISEDQRTNRKLTCYLFKCILFRLKHGEELISTVIN